MALKNFRKYILVFILFICLLFYTVNEFNDQFPKSFISLFNPAEIVSIDPRVANTFKTDILLKLFASVSPLIITLFLLTVILKNLARMIIISMMLF